MHSEGFVSEIHVWNADTGMHVANFVSSWGGSPEFDWLPDGRLFGVAEESSISFYDLEQTANPAYRVTLNKSELFSWSVNRKSVAITSECKRAHDVEVRDLFSSRLIVRLGLGAARKDFTRPGTRLLQWSPDGSELALLLRGGPFVIWKMIAREESVQ